MLEGNHLSFAYGNRTILEDITIQVRDGERVGLIGPSGCGKSTLAKILAGYARPEAGQVLYGGQPVQRGRYNPVQLIYQHPEQAVNPRMRMRQILRETGTQERELLEELEIEEAWLDRYSRELSGGELQRFCIARAMGPATKVLIADEISTMLDAISQAQLWEYLLRACEKRHMGLLAVSHQRALLERTCTRILQFEELTGRPRI